MANYNRIILVGNLTRDPQLKYLPSQLPVVEFGLAVNHRFKTRDGQDREEVLFIDCSCFGRGAEVINQYCQKGKQLLVEGRLKLDTWEDKQGGGKRSKHTVVVDNFQLMGGRDGGGGGASAPPAADESGATGGQRYPARPAAARPPAAQNSPGASASPPAPPYGEEQQFTEEDIPF